MVTDTKTGESWTLPDNGATRWRLNVSDGQTVVGYLTDRWRHWRTLSGDGGFKAAGQPITLYVGGEARRYRGMLLAASPSAGSTDRDTVNVLLMDSYIKGVIPREMPASWSPSAVGAQAVAARTYAAYEKQHPRDDHYQLCDTTSCQVYGGYDAEDSRSNDAVRQTAGVILTYDGTPAFTQFSSSSGGWTSANQFSYLPAKADPYDSVAINPNHEWTAKIDVARIERLWPRVGNLKTIRFTSRDGHGEWQGRVWSLVLGGRKNGSTTTVAVSGDTFRSMLGLKSAWFTVGSITPATVTAG
jgi:SpoIID/LytB domain protein